jgi:hypothetical protein
MPRSVAAILRPVTDGDLRGWRGLPSDLTLAEVTADFPRDSDWAGSAQLGRCHREAGYLWVDMPDHEKLRVWFDSERVVLLDLACSRLRVQPGLLAGLFEAGLFEESPASLDTWQGTLPMPQSELVFPAHGLAAFVNHETKAIWHMALFPPVTLDAYMDDLRIDMQTRRHQPLRR